MKEFLTDKIEIANRYASKFSADLLIKWEKSIDLITREERLEEIKEKKEDEEEEDSGEQMSNMMMMEYKPKRPKVYYKFFSPVLGERPEELGNSVVINKETYESIINCAEFDGETKTCSTEEWKREDTPYERT